MRASVCPFLALFVLQLACSSSKEDGGSSMVTRDPSVDPPGGLAASQVPQFVVIGNDDNAFTGLDGLGGLQFLMDMTAGLTNPAGSANDATFDGAPVRFTMYVETDYIGEQGVGQDTTSDCKTQWHAAYAAGNEVGLHTQKHRDGTAFTAAEWQAEISLCAEWVEKPWNAANVASNDVGIGVPADEVWGFRTPFLAYNDALFGVLSDLDIRYDCSIQEGFESGQDGTNYYWPYTLDDGSPANPEVLAHPGIWELPVYAYLVPPDDQCAAYGVPTGLRADLAARALLANPDSDFDPAVGKITGLDYNLWADFDLSGAEFVAVHKYTLDQRLAGNRAPFMIGMHTDLYHPASWDTQYMAGSTAAERMQAMRDVMDYALAQADVRVVRARILVTWLESPAAL